MYKTKPANKIQKIKRTDIFSKKKRSEVMSHIKSKGSKIEKLVGKFLWSYGFRYRKNVRNMFGNPDFVMKKHKMVVFADSCFWHGCKQHGIFPKSNTYFWKQKILRNSKRDFQVNKHYKKLKWSVIRIWEHDLKTEKGIRKIQKIIRKSD